MSNNGFDVTYLPVNQDGLIDLKKLRGDSITDKTLLVSIMAVHNEIGVIQPLKEIGQICRKIMSFFTVTALKQLEKLNFDVENEH